MAKKVICFALGGHISTQNASFRRLIELLEPRGYEFYGARNGFDCFRSGEVYRLSIENVPSCFAGFVCGSDRANILLKDGSLDPDMIQKARDFFKRGNFDIAIGSGGDDHGKQIDILGKSLEGLVGYYVLNKTMDNDLGGKDGTNNCPYTDFTSGFHTAVSVGADTIRNHFSGAWTNDLPFIVGHFGREANWVGTALTYYSNSDLFIYGELPKDSKGHAIEKIHDTILLAQEKNERIYGRRFAMVVVSEGTLVSGVDHLSEDLIDPHGHYKLNPEVLVIKLKETLEKKFKMKTHTAGITYEMRNFPPTTFDSRLARMSADEIAKSILIGQNGVESCFKINGSHFSDISAGVAPILKVSEKRYASFYETHQKRQFFNRDTFEVTDEIGKYYEALFGKRKPLLDVLPKKMTLVRI